MARLTRSGASELEHASYDLRESNFDRLRFTTARNETISFQLIVRRENRHAARKLKVRFIENSSLDSRDALIYQAHYHDIDNAAYNWGPNHGASLPCPLS